MLELAVWWADQQCRRGAGCSRVASVVRWWAQLANPARSAGMVAAVPAAPSLWRSRDLDTVLSTPLSPSV